MFCYEFVNIEEKKTVDIVYKRVLNKLNKNDFFVDKFNSIWVKNSDNLWERTSDCYLSSMVSKLVDDDMYYRTRTNREIVKLIKEKFYEPCVFDYPAKKYIPLMNYIYDATTQEKIEYSSNHHFDFKLPLSCEDEDFDHKKLLVIHTTIYLEKYYDKLYELRYQPFNKNYSYKLYKILKNMKYEIEEFDNTHYVVKSKEY